MQMTETPGSVIRAAREAMGLTQGELGERVSKTERQIRNYETDVSFPRRDTLRALRDELDLDPLHLVQLALDKGRYLSPMTLHLYGLAAAA